MKTGRVVARITTTLYLIHPTVIIRTGRSFKTFYTIIQTRPSDDCIPLERLVHTLERGDRFAFVLIQRCVDDATVRELNLW